jgi:hypothetical protein
MTGYRAFGLTIVSDFTIRGAAPLASVEPADLVIRAGPATLPGSVETNGPYSRVGQRIVFDAPNVARFLLKTPSTLIVEPAVGAHADDIEALLIATALPMVLWSRGGLVLHASGAIVEQKGAAVALCGVSGVGKSTLAHTLLERGGKLIGDDALWLRESHVTGLSAGYFLTSEATRQRQMIDVVTRQQVCEAKLGLIISLKRGDGCDGSYLRRLHGLDALEALLKNRHRPRIPTLLGLEQGLLKECALYISTIPVYEMTLVQNDVAAAADQIMTLAQTL